MPCTKCHSPKIIRFLDGFGEWRMFCKTCQESIPIIEPNKDVKKLWEFTNYYAINH
ncbi:MAG: hypothetical protein NTW30_04635 [Candidatus Aenigmarchaeota archaeon]|nr:hypothetical protein [Candidatus Aenigmarchaeota archaeon]